MNKYARNFDHSASLKLPRTAALVVLPLALSLGWVAQASAQMAPRGGEIDVATAQKIISAAAAEAKKGPPSSIVVVDTSGALIAAERMDGAFPASARIAQGKAETAAAFWQSTGNLEGAANGGRAALLSSGYVVMQGGIPLKIDGKVVGAIGVSGGTKDQDEAVAKAGFSAFEK